MYFCSVYRRQEIGRALNPIFPTGHFSIQFCNAAGILATDPYLVLKHLVIVALALVEEIDKLLMLAGWANGLNVTSQKEIMLVHWAVGRDKIGKRVLEDYPQPKVGR
jgi:hypothetical protein